ncbi:MAG TPA: class I SAM-dependent methyltransferase [Draconibacterium sp.]|nr:class I SAM-dependent methyltransferase [Draconibacterium sp.]
MKDVKGFKYNIPYDLDSPERTLVHKKIIRGKVFLSKLYKEWYSVFTKIKPTLPEGKIVELGSGGGFFKEFEPTAICSDILDLPFNDLTFSALDMPFEMDEVSAIFMIDTFHHIPDSRLFLKEAKRILKRGGMIIMIEPANSWWGRFIYRNFHHEPFNTKGDWTIPDSGPLSGANGALPWIVFDRDLQIFSEEFPDFKILSIDYHTPFRYLISGGVSYRQLMPGFTYPFFRLFDRLLSKLSKQISMFTTIKIQKVL